MQQAHSHEAKLTRRKGETIATEPVKGEKRNFDVTQFHALHGTPRRRTTTVDALKTFNRVSKERLKRANRFVRLPTDFSLCIFRES
jgi:hypothetical protein